MDIERPEFETQDKPENLTYLEAEVRREAKESPELTQEIDREVSLLESAERDFVLVLKTLSERVKEFLAHSGQNIHK